MIPVMKHLGIIKLHVILVYRDNTLTGTSLPNCLLCILLDSYVCIQSNLTLQQPSCRQR